MIDDTCLLCGKSTTSSLHSYLCGLDESTRIDLPIGPINGWDYTDLMRRVDEECRTITTHLTDIQKLRSAFANYISEKETPPDKYEKKAREYYPIYIKNFGGSSLTFDEQGADVKNALRAIAQYELDKKHEK